LIRRVDRKRRTLGQFFRDEIAEPLGLEFYIGLPAEVPDSRLARLKGIRRREILRNPRQLPWRFALDFGLRRGSLTARTFSNPQADQMQSDRRYKEVEIPAVTGVGEARAIARAYGELATGGDELGLCSRTIDALIAPPVSPRVGSRDLVLGYNAAYSLGFSKSGMDFSFGSGRGAFGTPGAGGSFGFADPETGTGFAYTMNRMGLRLFDDPREKALRDAVYRCLRSL
jgi:CubicO group peptidase (beta-lactamase class C family)